MSKVATKLKAPAAQPGPQTREQVTSAILEIGAAQRERIRIETRMNDEIAAIKARAEEEARPYASRIHVLSLGVQTWCEAHRGALTQDGRVKTANLSSGEVRWRVTPPKVVLRGVETLLQTLVQKGLDRLIRVKAEVNKEAVLAEPEAVVDIKGISIEQHEEFVIVPFETKIEAVS